MTEGKIPMALAQQFSERRPVIIAYLAISSAFLILDPILDFRGGESLVHVSLEFMMACVLLVGLVAILWDMRQERLRRSRLESDLRNAHSDVTRWRQEAQALLAGLGSAIDRQFLRWGLTPAERDVGILLLKGLSHKETADIRKTSERTVRQQARELYRKAGVGGRAELSAWFLEDLLLPDSASQHKNPPVEPGTAATVAAGDGSPA
jgi:DNA-binding CsgD family transcriptional regulator